MCFSVSGRKLAAERLNDYLGEQTRFGARVTKVQALGGGRFDILIAYWIHITDVFNALMVHPSVNELSIKPASDFGKVSVA